MKKPDEYFHFEQIFNFSTREYEYKVSQNGEVLYEYYGVNMDEKLTYLDSIFFSIKDQPGVNGPDKGDAVLWIDNLSVEYAEAEVSGFSCDGVLSPYEDSVSIEFDSVLKESDFSEYVEIRRNGELLNEDKYELFYSETSGMEGKYDTKTGHINIRFVKDEDFYNSDYLITIEEGIPTGYGGVSKGGSFKFSVPEDIGVYSAEIKDEFGRKLLHMADAAGKEVTLSVVRHDAEDKGYFAVAAIKDDEGRLVKTNTLSRNGDIKITVPEEVNSITNNAIYLDDIMFNAIIYGNIFENVETDVFVHGGRCNEMYSNVFIDVRTPVDVRHVYSTDSLGTIVANAYVALLNKAFSDAFPNLVKTMGDENSEPKYNKAYNNALINSGEVIFDETAISSATIENNKIVDYDIFNGQGYEINDNSSVHRLIPGFLNIEFERIGMRGQ